MGPHCSPSGIGPTVTFELRGAWAVCLGPRVYTSCTHTLPLGRPPPQADTPWADPPPKAGNPWTDPPPGRQPLGRHPLPGHPTGMHSC